jgi:hypothetical protein
MARERYQQTKSDQRSFVMAGLVPAIDVLFAGRPFKTWMPGTTPGMTMMPKNKSPGRKVGA